MFEHQTSRKPDRSNRNFPMSIFFPACLLKYIGFGSSVVRSSLQCYAHSSSVFVLNVCFCAFIP